jgi:cation diffusion facilitator family transporter
MDTDLLKQKDYTSQVRTVLVITLILNSTVALTKVVFGYLTNSLAMTSDGFHSFFDGVSNVIGLIGIWIASHPPDEQHPYGHKKFETMFTIIIGVMIFMTCFQIMKKVYQSFFEEHTTVVTWTSFIVMAITMTVNIFVMIYESRMGKKLCSEFLIADAMHTKSDVFASIAVIVSLYLTKLGYNHADIVVGIIITFLIARIGYNILKNASKILVDTICIDKNAIRSVARRVDGVKGCHYIRTRGSVNNIYLDLHINVDDNLPIEKAHVIADNVENEIKREFPAVVDIMVHLEPETHQH